MELGSFNDSRTNVSHSRETDGPSVRNSRLKELMAELVPIATVIVIANMVVFVLFARKRSLRTPTNLFLLSLSISDCANGMVNIPVFLAIFVSPPSQVATFMVAVVVLHNFTLTLTAYHILAVTADKYFAVMKPFRRRLSMTKSFVIKIIAAVWLLSATVAVLEIPTLVIKYDPHTPNQIYLVLYFMAVFVLPFAFMVYAYVVMFCTLRKRKTLAQRRHHTQIYKHLSSDWKCLLIFTTMLVVFLVCWCPSFVIRMVLYFSDPQEWIKSDHFEIVMHVSTIIRYGSSVLNPLLYTMLKTDFITALKTFTSSRSNVKRRLHSSTRVTRRGTITNTAPTPLIAAKYDVRKHVKLEQWQIATVIEQGTNISHITPADTEYSIQFITVI